MDNKINNFNQFLTQNFEKKLVRIIICGNVDDGKSTLIGRLLFDCQMIYEDQIQALKKDTKKLGTTSSEIDFSLLMDGLQAEREQKITIDVAYKSFSTQKRKFIIADTPGHIQYTRNMATGASTADAGIILVDAAKGVNQQTKRHLFILNLFGIKNVFIAVNKMDLFNYNQQLFYKINNSIASLLQHLSFNKVQYIPISALDGENLIEKSEKMLWYEDLPLLKQLETLDPNENQSSQLFSFPVQYVIRPNPDFRGYSGTISSGRIKTGDPIILWPSKQTSTVKEIHFSGKIIEDACSGQAVTLCIEDDLDISRGSIMTNPGLSLISTSKTDAQIIWMSDKDLKIGEIYDIKIAHFWTQCFVEEIYFLTDIESGGKIRASSISMNEIASVRLAFSSPILCQAYSMNKTLGSFILVDRIHNNTSGAGIIQTNPIEIPVMHQNHIIRQKQSVTKESRSLLKKQKPCIIWLTGLPGSGKSTLANALETRLNQFGFHTYLLDGDNIRHGLNKDLDFTIQGRIENIRRIGEVCKLFLDAGLIVISSFISPFAREREMIRNSVNTNEFIEIYLSTPLEICEKRDSKGHYAMARKGEISHFTGISSPYEPPVNPHLSLDTSINSAEDLVDLVWAELLKKGRLS